uniref:Uncharacterized protein n=1 Tax=Wuchereria bancrofti TaxID=6293 RepID=A0AAF5PSV4_WUCBA
MNIINILKEGMREREREREGEKEKKKRKFYFLKQISIK